MDRMNNRTIIAYALFCLAAPPLIINPGLGQLALSSLAVVFSFVLASKAAKDIANAHKSLAYAGGQTIAIVVIAAILYIAAAGIRDASPLPFTASALLVFLCVNLLFLALYHLAGRQAKKIIIGMTVILIGACVLHNLPRSIDVTRANMLRANSEIQIIYRYKNDLYYASNRYNDIHRLGADGKIFKIHETPRIKKRDDITLWLDDNMLYFHSKGKWYCMNLDTGSIVEAPSFQADGAKHLDRRYDFLGNHEYRQKIGYINHCKIHSDGYIYFSTNEGLYRTRPGSDVAVPLIRGEIPFFDIYGDRIIYYDVNRTPQVNEYKNISFLHEQS